MSAASIWLVLDCAAPVVAVTTDDAGGQEPQLDLQGVRVVVPAADEAPARELLADTARD